MEEHAIISLERYNELKENQKVKKHVEETFQYLFHTMLNFEAIKKSDSKKDLIIVNLDKQRLMDLFKATVKKDISDYRLEFKIIEEE